MKILSVITKTSEWDVKIPIHQIQLSFVLLKRPKQLTEGIGLFKEIAIDEYKGDANVDMNQKIRCKDSRAH